MTVIPIGSRAGGASVRTLNLLAGDCRASLAALAAKGELFDAIITDPPYHLTASKSGAAGFMGKAWDGGDIAFQAEFWRLVFAVLKPGGHMAAFGGTRTSHRMAVAIEDAGFEIRDGLIWLYGCGMPKARGALKPAHEPIILARKPFKGSIAGNRLAHGTGALNIEACRVPAADGVPKFIYSGGKAANVYGDGLHGSNRTGEIDTTTGRWPANVVHDGSPDVLEAFAAYGTRGAAAPASGATLRNGNTSVARGKFAGLPADREPAFHADTGTAARFFYCGKASKADRAGSKHPTVKPLALMRWLCTLITPPGGRILDPFAGSGSTLQAAYEAGFSATGCEREAEYQADIRRRIAATLRPRRTARAA